MNRRRLLGSAVGLLSVTSGCVIDPETSLDVVLVNYQSSPVRYELALSSGDEVVFSHEGRLREQTDERIDEETFTLSFPSIKTDEHFRVRVETEEFSAAESFRITCRPRDGGGFVLMRFRNGGVSFESSDCGE